jgi:hypothetical protein
MAVSYADLDALVQRLAGASWKERDAIKAELMAATAEMPDRKLALDHLDQAKRGVPDLEVRWEIDEVIEKLTPPPPKPAPKPDAAADAPPDPNKPLSAADLTVIYDDPRGLVLHKTKVGERWFATQVDPRTRQPQTFELRPDEITAVKAQLAGSPYWVPGAGV